MASRKWERYFILPSSSVGLSRVFLKKLHLKEGDTFSLKTILSK